MNDKQLNHLLESLKDDEDIVAVLLSRSGWVKAEIVRIRSYFPADTESPGLWAIVLIEPPTESHHTIFTTADAIVGVSIKRNHYAVIED